MVGIKKVKDLFEKDGRLKEFDKLRKDNPFLSDRLHFKWAQLIDSIPIDWRTKIRDNTTPGEVCMSKYGLCYYSHSGLYLVGYVFQIIKADPYRAYISSVLGNKAQCWPEKDRLDKSFSNS